MVEHKEIQPWQNGQEIGISFARERVFLPELNLVKTLFGKEPVPIPHIWAGKLSSTVGSHLDTLNPTQKAIIAKRFGIGEPRQTLRSIASKLGSFHQAIGATEKQAIEKLRKPPFGHLINLIGFLPPDENQLERIIFGDVTHREIREEVPNGPFLNLSLSEPTLQELWDRSLLRERDLYKWTIREFLSGRLRPNYPPIPYQTISEIFEALNNLKLQQSPSNV